MVFYLGFQVSYERSIAENNLLKRKLKESVNKLAELREAQSQREKEVAENNLVAQAKIRDLKSRLEASQTISECIRKDHSAIHAKFTFAREEANRLNAKLLDTTNEMLAQRSRAEVLS
jgi:hypothetical protein